MDSEQVEEKLRVQVVPAGAVGMATQKLSEVNKLHTDGVKF